MDDVTIEVDGIECVRNDTSSLEAWLMMHGIRKVLCGGEDFPGRKGQIAHLASVPLLQREIEFIEAMNRDGCFPSVDVFKGKSGIIGVMDYEVVESTDLPGWDGSANPVILSNPRWYVDGKLVSASQDGCPDDERRGPDDRDSRNAARPSRRRHR